jgi:acetylornithine deacetylase
LAPVRADVLALLRELVRIDTVAVPPGGHEAAGQRLLAGFLRERGLDVEVYDTGFLERSRHPYVRRDRHYKGRPNVVARLSGRGAGRSLLLSGHIDTVPPGVRPWRHGAFSGKRSGCRLYGRGAWDMKGGLAAQFGVALALRKAGLRLGGDLLCESVVDEEWAGGGGTLAARLRGDRADACVIPEGTNLAVVRATRGGHFFELLVRAGDPAAYFSKAEVTSPAVPMGRLLGWVDEWTQRRRVVRRGKTYAAFADPAPVQVLALEANRFDPGVPWSTPLEAKLRLYFQFLPHENVPAVIREVRCSLDRFCRRDPFFRQYPPVWRDLVNPPLLGHVLPAEHAWTRCLHRQASAVLRREVPVTAAEYPCDAFICQRLFDVPTLLFGPCGAGAHNADEYVTTASVLQTAHVLLAAALEWCG